MLNPEVFGGHGNKLVLFNSNWTETIVLSTLTDEKLLQQFEIHERLRIERYWEEKILSQEGTETRPWLSGLKMTKADRGFPQHFVLQTAALQRSIGSSKRGKLLNSSLRELSLIEQREALIRIRPKTRLELSAVVSFISPVFAPDFREMLSELGSVQKFVDHIVQALRTNIAPLWHKSRYLELLAILWGNQLILLPIDLPAWKVKHKYQQMLDPFYVGQRIKLIEEAAVLFALSNHKGLQGIIQAFFMSSSLTALEDLSLELIGHYESLLLCSVNESTRQRSKQRVFGERSRVNRSGHILRLLFNQTHPTQAISQTRSSKTKSTDGPLRGDGKFLWMSAARPELAQWATLFGDYVLQLTTARVDGQIGRLNFFGDYLVSLEHAPKSPLEIIRRQHIYDATLANEKTFFEFLRFAIPDKPRANGVLALMRAFFDWFADYLTVSHSLPSAKFANPILSTDRFGKKGHRPGQTFREALPSYVLQELKSILIEDDFAFSRNNKLHQHTVIDSVSGVAVREWFPGLTVCLYAMFDTPLRSHQARWLDSGLLDERVMDASSLKYARNPSKCAIPGRREGVLRLQHDSLRKSDWLGLWVNTNKTAVLDGSSVGYLIPYVSDQLSEMLIMMQSWQARYLPMMDRPIAYYDIKHSSVDRKRISEQGPQIAPLFREPTARTKNAPVTYERLVHFYTTVLAEAQKRIKQKYGHDVNLVTRDADGTLHWTVDLHTLRVSGITAMIESGVPLEVVSQFVAGHATLVMTLHYLKYSPLKIREILKAAHAKAEQSVDFVGSDAFLGDLESFAPFLLTQEGAGQGAGFSALREKSGIFTIASDGICPGTSCSSGGPVDSSRIRHGPVPGGQRCGLCRYWLTGPAHLLGQVASVNNLAYAIRKKGQEVATLNDDRIEAEDAQDRRKAREIRDRVDLLNRELSIDVEEWAARYRYAEESAKLMDSYLNTKAEKQGEKSPVPFLTAGTSAELKVTLEEAHEFQLLDQITQMSDFVTGFTNATAEMEKAAILTRMMVVNGIKPFLMTLDAKQAHEAGNLLSSLLLHQVDTRDLDDVLQGRKPLTSFPHLSSALERLSKAADDGALRKGGRWNALLDETALNEAANSNEEMHPHFA